MPDRQDLISDSYLEEQRRLHADPRGYGGKGRKWAMFVDNAGFHYHLSQILDYGCGQGSLATTLRAMGWEHVTEYDPAIAGKDSPPEPADLVVCTDVLEHIEPDKLDAVLDHLAALSRRALFVVISLVPTAKTLADGRQAHISLHPAAFWAERLEQHFRVVEILAVKPDKQWVALLLKKEPA
jgi:2-polyprenyl-3-methyl-5-hydroxy-6-metoxy-1,4-benzoquinol methylase